MNIAIHQPNFFPWIGYFYKIKSSDCFVFLDDVQYSKNSYTNRVNIINEKKQTWLTLPVNSKLGLKINNIHVADKSWKDKHLSKITNAYRKTKFFLEVFDKVKSLFDEIESENLAVINQLIIRNVSSWLELNKKFYTSSELNINKDLKGDDRLIEIVRTLGGKIYFSGKGGNKYQNEEKFKSANISLRYSNFKEKEYTQKSDDFIYGNSILDLLFNLGMREAIQYLES